MQYSECSQVEIQIQLHPLPRILSADDRSTMFQKNLQNWIVLKFQKNIFGHNKIT